MTMQHCTDESTDKEMSSTFLADGEGHVFETGYPEDRDRLLSDSFGKRRRHVDHLAFDITGDFNSAYTVKSKSHNEGGSAICAWIDDDDRGEVLGACKPDQKAATSVMPGGVKMNVKDMEKLKALIPKQPPK